jgi:hypothetical protein
MCLSNMRHGSTSDKGPSRAGPSGAGTPDAVASPSAPAGPSGAGPSAHAGPSGISPSALAGPSSAGPSVPVDPPGQPARTRQRQRIPQGTSIRRKPRERRMSSVYKRQPKVSHLLFFFVTLCGLVNSYLNTC